MPVGLSPNGGWVNCPECHRPMPPEDKLCKECQLKEDLKTGIHQAKADNFAEALRLFNRVCEADGLEEERAAAHYYSGVIFAKQHQLDRAQEAWRKCLELEPGYIKAKKRLIELILQKPKRQRDKFERQLVEGSEFAKAIPAAKTGPSPFWWIRCALALAVLVALGILGYWGFQLSMEYFTFDRHIENIENLVLTGQFSASLQYFNDHFRQGEGSDRRERAQQVLAPVYKRAAKELMDQGDQKQARQMLKIAAGFDPLDLEVQELLESPQPESPEAPPTPSENP